MNWLRLGRSDCRRRRSSGTYGSVRRSGKSRDDFFGRGFADGAGGIPNAALRQSVLTAAGARVRIEAVESNLFLLGREFREVHAGQLRGAIGVLEKNFAFVLKGFDFGKDGETEQGANFRLIKLWIQKSDVLLNDTALGIQKERRRQGGDAAVLDAQIIGCHGDGVVDSGFVDVFLNLGGVVIVDIEADDLEMVLVLFLQSDQVGNLGAARSTPGGPEIQKDNFALEGGEGERLTIERGELEIGRGIGVADKADDGFVVLLRGTKARQDEKKQSSNERTKCALMGRAWLR